MKAAITVFTILIVSVNVISAQDRAVFSSLDSLINYTAYSSSTLKSDNIKFDQAKAAKLAAIAGVPDITGNVSLNITNNTRLPVNIFPAEILGGPPGTFQEVRLGTPYINTFSQYAEVKLLNISGWQNLKLAKLNIESIVAENKISRKTLYENIAANYYNILALQEQLKTATASMLTADTLLQIVKNKNLAGIARQQDVNDAEVNFLSAKESANQIQFSIDQQLVSLKILCDIPESTVIEIRQDVEFASETIPEIQFNNLGYNSKLLAENYAYINYRQNKYTLLPTISGFASNSQQQFGNNFSLFDQNVSWINSNYIGLKAVWNIPSATTISQISKSKFDYLLARENAVHNKLKAEHDFTSLKVNYDKNLSQMNSDRQIAELQEDTYRKNFENYKEGIIDLYQLLTSYNSMVNSRWNYISTTVNVMLAQSKIQINNTIQ